MQGRQKITEFEAKGKIRAKIA